LQFNVLGSLEVTSGGRPLAVGGARTRAVLAMLLMNANQVVSAGRLADELWPNLTPDRAANNLQVRLSELRKALRSVGEGQRLVTRAPSYLLRATTAELDALRFAELVAAGRAALAAGDAALADERLAEALGLWRGQPLADVDEAPFARAEASRLEEARLAALELIAELDALTAANPLREPFWSQRMLALYRAGRQKHRRRDPRNYDGPGRAIRCADALREHASDQGIQIRAAVHTGEIEVLGDDITGISVHITSRINDLARSGEILVSRTVKDLVAGSEISFADQGPHNLSGVAEQWDVFAVTRL
jgi:DNA-binding SARP family transcriptional activator